MQSPCVGFCSTTLGDPICRGCKRSTREVDAWNRMTSEQQAAVWERLWQQLTTVVPCYLQVLDARQLQQQLEQRGIRHHPKAPPEAWALDLLRVGCQHTQDLTAYGLKPTPRAGGLSPAALFNCLNRELLAESQVYNFCPT